MAKIRDFSAIGVGAILAVVALAFLMLHAWWTIADSSRAQSRSDLSRAITPDITPAAPVRLAGNVGVIGVVGDREPMVRNETGVTRYRQGCEALCAALLAAPAVTSVTVIPVAKDRESPNMAAATRFRLVPRAACDGETVKPQNPDRLGDRQGVGQSLATAWALRLSTEDCIVAEPAQGSADVTIARYSFSRFGASDAGDWHWTLRPLGVSVQRLDILDAAGAVRFRRSYAATEMISRPLHPGIVGVKGFAMPVFGWARTKLSTDPTADGLDVDRLILRHTDLRPTIVAEGLAAKVRARIETALKDPALPATDTAFDLVDGWIRGLPAQPIEAADRALLVALIGDRRVTDFQGMWEVTRKLGEDANLLRAPILRRIERDGAHPDEKTGAALHALAAQLPLMPRSDASVALEQAILRDPGKRLHAKGLIIVQAERGAPAVPLLLEILRDPAGRQANPTGRNASFKYGIGAIDGVQLALCRIGPAAGAAVPALRRMTAEGLIPSNMLDDRNWKFMLAPRWPRSASPKASSRASRPMRRTSPACSRAETGIARRAGPDSRATPRGWQDAASGRGLANLAESAYPAIPFHPRSPMEVLVPAFLLALLAQPGDRPALLTAILADRFRRPLTVALAAGVAHGIGSVLAALAGAAVAPMLKPEAQALLLAIALLMGAVTGLWQPRLSDRVDGWRLGAVFTTLAGAFVLALGEQTQFFTFALAARGTPWLAAAGSTLGALVVGLAAASLGEAGWTRLPLRWVRYAVSVLFLIAGLAIGLSALRLTG